MPEFEYLGVTDRCYNSLDEIWRQVSPCGDEGEEQSQCSPVQVKKGD